MQKHMSVKHQFSSLYTKLESVLDVFVNRRISKYSTLSSFSLENAYQSALVYLKQRMSLLKRQLTDFDANVYEKLALSDPHRLYRWTTHKEELSLLKFGEMTNSQWRQNYGPQLTRSLAKLFRIISTPTHNEPPVLPYDTESGLNLIASFHQHFMGRGNIILPEQTLFAPTVSFTIDSESLDRFFQNEKSIESLRDAYVSLFMIDLDHPDAGTSKLVQYCHWAHVDIQLSTIIDKPYHSSTISSECSGTTLLPYQPPSPQRGTGYHRYLLLLVSHDGIIQSFDNSLLNLKTRTLDLHKWWDSTIRNPRLSILSYTWFRSCWTKHVKDPQNLVFGNTIESLYSK